MATNDGGPAFPISGSTMLEKQGMSLRDYFAAAALTGLLANPESDWSGHIGGAATEAHYFADVMLAERAKTNDTNAAGQG